MGALEQAIQKAIAAQFDRMRIVDVFTGTAKNVGETSCDIVRENAPTIHNARLNAIDVSLDSYATIYPAEDSTVVVAIVEGLKTEAVVLRCSEVERIGTKMGEHSFVIDKNGTVFDGGKNKGMLKLDEVFSWMQEVYTDMQMLKTLLKTTPIAGNGAPAAISFTPQTHQPKISDLENEKVKH